MRRIAAALLVIACAGPAPATAGSASSILAVRATVAAACGIDAGQLLSPTHSTICLPASQQSTIVTPEPTVTLTQNAATDVSMLTVSF
jgi:hypothetical protein